ncbi:MAG: glycoside hydrolase family 28 protein [Verrucomicrobiota bacterium]|jgi:polygalacturonase
MKKLLFTIAPVLSAALVCLPNGLPAQQPSRVDVRSVGATGNGADKDTAAFQKALDTCAAGGGGTVVVPEGTYLIGSVTLGSRTTLELQKGARLLGSPDTNDYPLIQVRWEGRLRPGHRGLIFATNATQIAIVGEGSIEGNAALGPLRNPRGPCLIEPVECKDVRLEGFSTKFVRLWSIHVSFCDGVVARNLTLRSTGSNGDGIDVDSSKNVRIEHCDIDTGDDCIALKSGRGSEGVRIGRPTEDVVVTNCTLGSGFAGLAIGTELSGGIRRIRVEDCAFTRGANSIFIKSREDRAGYIEEITGKNLDCRATTFLVIDLLDKGIKDEEPVTGLAGWTPARRISFSNIKVNVTTLLDAHLVSPDKPLDGLSISNVTGVCRRAINLANITNATLRDILVTGYTGPFLTKTNATGPGLDKITTPDDTSKWNGRIDNIMDR